MSTKRDALRLDQEHEASDALSILLSEESSVVPACSVCGRQDETLRAVIYPYMYSLIAVTFRRRFYGVWCRKHRNLRWLLASWTTATFGWLGVPFGLWTPVTLFKLARGGEQPRSLNQLLLKKLADHKQQEGDQLGALRCLEASLRFGDDEHVKERVRQLHAELGLPGPRPAFQRVVSSLPPALLVSCFVAAVAFILDSLVTALLSRLMSSLGSSLYLAVFSWLPGIGIAFIAGLILSQVAEQAVTRLRVRKGFVGGALAVAMTFLAGYGILEGVAIGEHLAGMVFSGGHHASLLETILQTTNALIAGAPFVAVDLTEPAGTADTLYTVFIASSFIYYLAIAMGTALRTAEWQRRLPRLVALQELGGSNDLPMLEGKRTGCLIGCGASVLVLCILSTWAFGAVQVWTTIASRAPLSVELDCPRQVHEGETFEAVVSIRNQEQEPGSDLAIDLDSSLELNFFEGISVIQTDPPYSSVRTGSSGHHFYRFGLTVMPGQTRGITFELRAERPGDFQGILFVDVTTDAGRVHTRGTPIYVTVLP